MPESKLHAIFVALIISRILYALPAWGGFLNSHKYTELMLSYGKLNDLGSAALCVYVMY